MKRLLLTLVLLLGGCLGPGVQAPVQTLGDQTISVDTTWRGELLIDGTVKVVGGAVLTIEPGTVIRFVRRDADQDGLGDARIEVERASLKAIGNQNAPIRFLSAEQEPKPGDWLELKADFARELQLRWVEIRHSAHGLHTHFSNGAIEDSILSHNIDGTRFGQGRYRVSRCLVTENSGKGLNFRNSEVEIVGNIIRHNRAGIFIFETDRSLKIEGNNFFANDDHVRLGDFFTGEISLGRNWFGTTDPQQVAAGLYDRGEDPSIGVLTAVVAEGWLPQTGPQRMVELRPAWAFATNGFVDAAPAVDRQQLYLPSWDARLYALDHLGVLRWQQALDDVVDSSPIIDDKSIYLQTWSRQVVALSRDDGRILWRVDYPESPADDHRQGGLTLSDGQVLVPGWNGVLYAYNPADGALLWQAEIGQPLRSAPVVTADRIYQAAGDGSLVWLTRDGKELGRLMFSAPLLTSPRPVPGGLVQLSKSGELAFVDDEGEIRWRTELNEVCFYAAPVAHNGRLWVATAAGGLHCVDLENGQVLWRVELEAAVYAPLALRDGILWFGDNGGTFHAINAESGDVLGRHRAGDAIQSGAVWLPSAVGFGSRDGSFHLLRVRTSPGD